MKYLSVILLCQIVIFAGCKKTSSSIHSQRINLRNKSLAEIKLEVSGNWKIHYMYGGRTGNTKTLLTNSFFKVVQNDSIYLTINNIPFAGDIATFQRLSTNFGYTAYTMNFTSFGGTPYQWIVDQKINDSLVLDDNSTSGHAYVMTRIP